MQLAPVIKHYGQQPPIDENHPYARLNVEFMDWLMCTFGNSSGKLRYMYYLASNLEGYAVVNKTVQERIGITPPNQCRIRGELADEGWIYYDPQENLVGINWENVNAAVHEYLRTRGLEKPKKKAPPAVQQEKAEEQKQEKKREFVF